MQRAPTPSLLLDVWREVCRHIEIDESLARLVPILTQTLPVTSAAVRRFDGSANRLVTIASGGEGRASSPSQARRELTPEEAALVREWLRSRRVQTWRSGDRDRLRELLVPAGLDGAVVAGPLHEGGGDGGDGSHRSGGGDVSDGDGGTGGGATSREPSGLLVLEGTDDLIERANVVQLLLEPIGVALANDRRLHEMGRLREAAEAENRALLSRLQRSDISESIVGADRGLKEVMTSVEQVSRTDAPVLILGDGLQLAIDAALGGATSAGVAPMAVPVSASVALSAPSPRLAAASKGPRAPPRASASTHTRCARACASSASTGSGSAAGEAASITGSRACRDCSREVGRSRHRRTRSRSTASPRDQAARCR